jgi:peptidoglycan/LPS O-acetylase OafA/YrhL
MSVSWDNSPTVRLPVVPRARTGWTGAAPDTSAASGNGSGGGRRFRPDVEGLRAVAITLVLLFHAGLPIFRSGYVGVDVFFVISGFLITGMLVAELRHTNTISLLGFYGRRVRRLLPAAGVVLLATFLLVRFVLPNTRWSQASGDILSSALYVVNWRLADRSVDYLAEGSAPSPVQHFCRRSGGAVLPGLAPVAAVAVWLPAAGAAVGAGAVGRARAHRDPLLRVVGRRDRLLAGEAFFQTTTRMWELGIGAAVAFAARIWARVPATSRSASAGPGSVAIVGSGVVFSTRTAWPGSAAWCRCRYGRRDRGRLRGRRRRTHVAARTGPFQQIGGLSYSLYLWHWPLLVVATELPGAACRSGAGCAWWGGPRCRPGSRTGGSSIPSGTRGSSRSIPRTWSLAAAFT